MNVGEKINLYKERLGFKYLKEMADIAGVKGAWLNELSKKEELNVTDIISLRKLCKYLNITVDQLINDDDLESQDNIVTEFKYIDSNCDDIGLLIGELELFLSKENVKFDGILLDTKVKQICKDSLDITKKLVKQCL